MFSYNSQKIFGILYKKNIYIYKNERNNFGAVKIKCLLLFYHSYIINKIASYKIN